MSTESSAPLVHRYLAADVKCYLCGSVAGRLESEQLTTPRTGKVQVPGESSARSVTDWRRMRCPRCGGPVFLDDAAVVTDRVETVNWLEDRPRRGRPPKRVIEQRRRDLERLNSQAA